MSFKSDHLHVAEDHHAHESDEAEDSGSDSSSGDEMAEEDEETYVKFVRSVFCDDYSGCSNDDEDDEEDYEPDNKDDDGEDDDDEDDRDVVRVQNRELRELVDGCWQTIVGEAPDVAALRAKDDAVDESGGTPIRKRAGLEEAAATLSPSANLPSGLFDQIDDDLDFSLLSPMPSLMKGQNSGAASSGTANDAAGATRPTLKANGAAGPSVISSMVTKLFSEHETSEVHVEGMPVHACRKLVARQMSMATQLLVQMLLQADERSECFTKAYTSLMELSNLREAALRKAALVQMNFHNATTIRNHVLDRQQQKQRENHHGSSAGSANDAVDDSSAADADSGDEYGIRSFRGAGRHQHSSGHHNAVGSDVARMVAGVPCQDEHGHGGSSNSNALGSAETSSSSSSSSGRRLTRSTMREVSASHTVFNVPILAKVATLFDMIDISRRNIRQRTQGRGGGALTSGAGSTGMNGGGAGENSPQQRIRTMHAIKEQIYTIMPALNSRAWRCLLPNALYPLPLELIRTLDPTTLTGRCLFTPTEDDLLLRGIMNTAEANWEQVRTFYLPSKEAQLLQFRYTQMTSISALEDNNFKRYQKLSIDYRERNHQWSLDEELELLRGFQAFGERWPLVRIFHLPHRRPPQLRAKWFQLQKLWQKTFQSQSYKGAPPKQLPRGMREFLTGLNSHAVRAVRARVEAAKAKSETGNDEAGTGMAPTGQRGRAGSDTSRSPACGAGSSSGSVPTGTGLGGLAGGPLPGLTTGTKGLPPLPSIPPTAPMPYPMAMPAPMPLGMPFAVAGASGAPTGAMPGYPFPMPPFMMPPFMPLGGRMPTTPAEMQAYQQQMQQYQQMAMHYQMAMMAQYQQMIMHQQHQQQHGYGTHAQAGAGVSKNATATSAPFGELNAAGPPLLRANNNQDDSTTQKNKRARQSGCASSAGNNVHFSSPTAEDAYPDYDADHAGAVGAGASASVAVTEEVSRGGYSFLHDGDSLFSLLMPGNSVAYIDGNASVPILDSESNTNSMSREGSLLSRVKAAADAAKAGTSSSVSSGSGRGTLFASLQAATGRAGDNPPPGAATTASAAATTAAVSTAPTTKSPTSAVSTTAASTAPQATATVKPRKTIKPTLISVAAATMDSKRASPVFASASAAASFVSSVSAFQSVAKVVPTSTNQPQSQAQTNTTAQSSQGGRGREGSVASSSGSNSMPPGVGSPPAALIEPPKVDRAKSKSKTSKGKAGAKSSASGASALLAAAAAAADTLDSIEPASFSNMNWPDMDLTSRAGEGSLHSPLLEDISMMDASKFAFSNLSHKDASRSHAGSKRKAATDGTSVKSTNGQQVSKKKRVAGAADAISASTTVLPTGPSAVAGADAAAVPSTAFAFDDTSNMSLLGDMFGDGDLGGTGHAFSNMTNMLGLLSPQKASRPGASGMNSNSHKRGLDGLQSSSSGEGAKKQRTAGGSGREGAPAVASAGIFAEVMAKAQKTRK